MKILITGAGGFVGSRLSSMMQGDPLVEVVAVVRQPPVGPKASNINWVVADITNPAWTQHLPVDTVDVVIHLAQSRHYRHFPEESDDLFAANVSATHALAQWSRTHGVKRFIFASSGSVYGTGHEGPLHEGEPCSPDSMYGATKLSSEILLKPFAEFFDVLVLRLFTIYGPGQVDAMFPNIFRRLMLGEPIVLANGIGVYCSPIYVDDCTRLILRFAQVQRLDAYEVINIGSTESTNLGCAIALMEKIANVSAQIQITPDMPKNIACAANKLEGIMGPQDFITLKEGLQRTFGASAL